MKKVLVVDDSALMRRVLSDIINSDERFTVTDEAINGVMALDLLQKNTYDLVVLDVNMPKMDGIQLLKELRVRKICVRIVMASTMTFDGAQITMEALELGAMDFVHKPDWSYQCKNVDFKEHFLSVLEAVSASSLPTMKEEVHKECQPTHPFVTQTVRGNGKKIVAIACSTGGPKALQSVLPYLSEDINAPIVIVQHMPVGFTLSFAQRLDQISKLKVKEAVEGDILENGYVYIAKSGYHLNLVTSRRTTCVHYTEEPYRKGVRPSANYMYESLEKSDYDEIVCVVMTGMGEDGTEGILHLKEKKNTYVITQDEESCVVYGMPKSVVNAGLSDLSVSLSTIAKEIILRVGVK